MKGYATKPRSAELDTQHQMQFSAIPRKPLPWGEGSYILQGGGILSSTKRTRYFGIMKLCVDAILSN